MPIYEYRCKDCGFQDEFLQKVSEAPLSRCPSCGKESLQKLLSAAGFQLKGSGWYATDFKNSGAKVAKPEKNDSKPASEGNSGSKPDPKTDTKSEPKGEAAATGGPAPA